MNFSLKNLNKYCTDHSSIPHEVLYDLERETHLKTLAPQMLSGPLQGQLLYFLTRLNQPNHVLEIGTFTGYATICMAAGLPENGIITTLESNKELQHISDKYFESSGLKDKIKTIIGDARSIVPTLSGPFDMVFIDAGKQDYSFYFDQIIDKVNAGGLILADNVLWSGKVTMVNKDNDTKAMDDFNKKILSDTRVEKLILPIRDGINLIMKISS